MTGPAPEFRHRQLALRMLNELHRLGFEQLRFASTPDDQLFIYAATDAGLSPHWAVSGPAARQFTLPCVDDDPINGRHLCEKWLSLLSNDLKPHHLAGMFVLDFPDVARYGYGTDLPYREWFKGLLPQLDFGLFPLTHDIDNFGAPYDVLRWETRHASKHPQPYLAAPADDEVIDPELETEQAAPHKRHPFAIDALLMLNELHRFGFEQLRFESYGGHGWLHLFAACDEVPGSCHDHRFIPAVRRFSVMGPEGHSVSGEQELSAAWRQLLLHSTRPNHLAGLFLLDYPDVARHGFGADEAYRDWFRALMPNVRAQVLPLTHEGMSHAHPLRELSWIPDLGPALPRPAAAPINSYLPEQEQ